MRESGMSTVGCSSLPAHRSSLAIPNHRPLEFAVKTTLPNFCLEIPLPVRHLLLPKSSPIPRVKHFGTLFAVKKNLPVEVEVLTDPKQNQ
jgi:hypothetical protein